MLFAVRMSGCCFLLLLLLAGACGGRTMPFGERAGGARDAAVGGDGAIDASVVDSGIVDSGARDSGIAAGEWTRRNFSSNPRRNACTGGHWVKQVPQYNLWIGAILCSTHRYKLFLSETRDGPYIEIGDTAGHGQDHCELVNPNFTIPVEDDITSGGCTACATGQSGPIDGAPAYFRAKFGENFTRTDSASSGVHTADWLECGVEIP